MKVVGYIVILNFRYVPILVSDHRFIFLLKLFLFLRTVIFGDKWMPIMFCWI